MADIDPELVLAVLSIEDRAAVERWCVCLGIGRDGWALVPAFRSVIELLAILTTADRLREEKPELSVSAAFYKAADDLGFEDDDQGRATHPAATPDRRLRNWLRRAWRLDSGQKLRSRKTA